MPEELMYDSWRHSGQVTLSGVSVIFSRHGWQNVWKHGSTLGMVYVSLQMLHFVFRVTSVSPSEEFDVKLIVSAVEGVGDDDIFVTLASFLL